GRGNSHYFSGTGNHVLGRRRLIVGNIENAIGGRACKKAQRPGDVVCVDAVENLPLLDAAARRALFQPEPRIAAGAIYARQAQYGERDAMTLTEGSPCCFGMDALQRAARNWLARRGFIDPSALMIAIDANG